MTADVRDWLPASAFSKEALSGSLRGVLSDWSSRWFARAAAEISAVRAGESAGTVSNGHAIVVQKECFDIEVPMRGKRVLLEGALDVNLAESPLREGDRRVLDLLAERIAHDLAGELEAALNPAPTADARTIRITVSIGLSEGLVICAAAAALVPLIKSQCARARDTSSAPVHRVVALRQSPIRAHAYIGRADIALTDLQSLDAGDVLVLDSSLGDPVELRLAGGRSLVARGKLCRSADSLSIQL